MKRLMLLFSFLVVTASDQNIPFPTHLSSQLSQDNAAQSSAARRTMTVKWLAKEPKVNRLPASLNATKHLANATASA